MVSLSKLMVDVMVEFLKIFRNFDVSGGMMIWNDIGSIM